MKNALGLITACLIIIACEKNNNDDNGSPSQEISMGTNSAYDIYFSLANGEVKSVNRSDWDIAFSVPLQTATILINEGAGVELYCVGDTNDWNIVNETNITGLSPRFNDESDWLLGAFNVNATGFPNYGWGTYHAGNPDHNVGGDSLYIIRLTNGSLKKFMMRAKLGVNSVNVFRWADLDGQNEMTGSVGTSEYVDTKHFIHFSLVNNEIVEADPDKSEWDILFTRYLVKIPAGPSVFLDYPVIGVLSNPDVSVARITDKDPESVVLGDSTEFSNRPDAIGFDWKISDPVTHEISLADSTSYIIESVDGSTWLLYFTGYGGYEEGSISFNVRPIE